MRSKSFMMYLLSVFIFPGLILQNSCKAASGTPKLERFDCGNGQGVVRSDGIPGGELDFLLEIDAAGTRTLLLTWDGADSAPDRLDPSGLGGIDLVRTCRFGIDPDCFGSRILIRNDKGRLLDQPDFHNVGSIEITVPAAGNTADVIAQTRAATGWFTVVSRTGPVGREMIDAELVIQQGDNPPGGGSDTISSLNNPFTNGNGQVGFTGVLTNGTNTDNFVWYDTAVVWRNSAAAPTVLTGAEATMGIGDLGEFIYSPSTDGMDSVWTSQGLLLKKGDPAPGFAAGTNNTFNSRPTMLPDGTAVWVAGFDDTGGTTTQGRAFYRSVDLVPGNIQLVMRSDDLIGAYAIDRSSGIGFDYMVSDSGDYHIQELILDTGSANNDDVVALNGTLIARESDPAPENGNWDNFDRMVVNDSGHYAFSGDTDGDINTDEFICYDGSIVIREGDTIGGVELVGGSTLNVMSINNENNLIHEWLIDGVETLLYTCSPMNAAVTSYKILATGDTVDLDGDMGPDATVTALNATGSASFGYWLAENGYLFAEVDLDYGGGAVEAIIRIPLPVCEPGPCLNTGDVDLNGTLTAGDAQMAFLIVLGIITPTYEQACATDCNGDDSITAGDAQQIFLTVLGTATCSDLLPPM